MITSKLNIVTTQDQRHDFYKDFGNNKEMFDFSNHSTKSKYYYNWNKLVFGKKKKYSSWCCDWRIYEIKAKYVFAFGKW